MRVAFVLRSAEVQPLFSDLCSTPFIPKNKQKRCQFSPYHLFYYNLKPHPNQFHYKKRMVHSATQKPLSRFLPTLLVLPGIKKSLNNQPLYTTLYGRLTLIRYRHSIISIVRTKSPPIFTRALTVSISLSFMYYNISWFYFVHPIASTADSDVQQSNTSTPSILRTKSPPIFTRALTVSISLSFMYYNISWFYFVYLIASTTEDDRLATLVRPDLERTARAVERKHTRNRLKKFIFEASICWVPLPCGSAT
jgi:hypothetical protein